MHLPCLGILSPQLTFSPWVPFSPLGPCRDGKETDHLKQNLSPLPRNPTHQHPSE